MKQPDFSSPDPQTWLSEHTELPEAERTRLWALTQATEPFFEPEPDRVDAMRQVLHQAMEPAQADRVMRPRSRHRTRWIGWGIAASLLLAAASTIWWPQSQTIFHAPLGDTQEITLADGSTVHLNSGATLHLPRGFGTSTRTLYLEGEAFFDVAHTDTPFIIETFNASVTVLGTQFNVTAWPMSPIPSTRVALKEGRVLFAAEGAAAETVQLVPGQQSEVVNNRVNPAVLVDVPKLLAWRTGGLAYDNEPLPNVLADLERRFAITIVVPADFQTKRIALFADHVDTIEDALLLLGSPYGFTFRTEGTRYVLHPNTPTP